LLINSLYSFWWDVTNDWGLELLRSRSETANTRPPVRPLMLPHLHSRSPLINESSQPDPPMARASSPLPDLSREEGSSKPVRRYPHGLRPILLYPLPVYPILIFLNLILRLTWSMKLSSHLHSKADGTIAIFYLEIAEILRRWMWVFVRIEWEVVRNPLKTGKVEDTMNDDDEYEMIPTIAPEE
jgi:hypothetical protein